LEDVALIVPVCVMPGVLDNKRRSGISFKMGLPVSGCTAGDAACALHDLVEDNMLTLAVSFELDCSPLEVIIVGSDPSSSWSVEMNSRIASRN
jgi:hypothetical protein